MSIYLTLGFPVKLSGYPVLLKGSKLVVVNALKYKGMTIYQCAAGKEYPVVNIYHNSDHTIEEVEEELPQPELKIYIPKDHKVLDKNW